MIQVTYVRTGLHVVAIMVDDNRDVHFAVAFTQRGALKKLVK